MSEENVEAVRESYQIPGALFATWAERMAPKIEFDFTAVYPERPVLRGIEELQRFREEGPWAEADASFAIDYASAAIDEAEYAVLDATLARKKADEMAAAPG